MVCILASGAIELPLGPSFYSAGPALREPPLTPPPEAHITVCQIANLLYFLCYSSFGTFWGDGITIFPKILQGYYSFGTFRGDGITIFPKILEGYYYFETFRSRVTEE